jgi:hypothetical protein
MGSLWNGEICRSSAAIARIALIAVAGCGGPRVAPPEPIPPQVANSGPPWPDAAPGTPDADTAADPAHVEGEWSYSDRATCKNVEGEGTIELEWDSALDAYDVRGNVSWPEFENQSMARFWGTARYESITGELEGTVETGDGDTWTGSWELDGSDRLKVEWEQPDGCSAIGTGTRLDH